MPLPGSKPSDQPVRRRNKPEHGWTEVDAIPFECGPDLPPKRGAWTKATRRWWQAVRTMPHCALWDPSDWQFAMDTAYVAAAFHAGNIKAATELRQREKVMGTTVDARRDLRIRYVEPAVAVDSPSVTIMADYRKALEE